VRLFALLLVTEKLGAYGAHRHMEDLLTHVAMADCFLTQPHPALECGIVTARWQSQVEGDTAMRRQQEGEQRQRQPQERG
jgi:hypothetical protein